MSSPGPLSRYLDGALSIADFEHRIAAEEPKIHAWVEVRREESSHPGPLHGAPFGVKDIVDVRGYRNTNGSHIFAHRVSGADAALVELIRSKGGVVMGKTQTTSFAYFDPAPTRNPRNPAHTPGGSSSGSAAAVACEMVPFAIGSQTQGSVLRPASFCGVTGFKPTFNALPVEGFMPFAPSLDTAGFFTANALDMRLLWLSLGLPAAAELPEDFGMIELPCDPVMQETFRNAVQILGHYGCRVRRIQPPGSFHKALDAVRTLQTFEGARTLRQLYAEHGAAIGAKLAELVRTGLAMPEDTRLNCLRTLELARQEMDDVFQTYPVLLSPAAVGQAPEGLASTGDPRNNAYWTGLHTPAISIPMPVADGFLPMGLQMTAARGNDGFLLAAACHCHALLHAKA
ncbi:MAG: amidase [Candidatus Solibacter usitatus]|nr:amidase [Candidatus Solibacter usitatus]